MSDLNSSALQLSTINDVKIYACHTGKSVPEWLNEFKAKRTGGKLKYNTQYRQRIELIQDFRFTTASTRICETPDKQYISVTGVYKPCIKLFDCNQLTMKYERYTDSEIVAQQYLDTDYRKLALLRNDRTIELHAAYGKHVTVRIPKFGRDIVYNRQNCDLYTSSASNELYRLNLDIGQFLQPITVESQYVETINNIVLNPVHSMLTAGSGGQLSFSDRIDNDIDTNLNTVIRPTVLCYDTRDRQHIGTLDIIDSLQHTEHTALHHELQNSINTQVTALQYDTDGLTCAVGLSNGTVLLYDIRSLKPIHVYTKHRYEQPIVSIKFHNTPHKKHILSMDSKQVRIWEQHSGQQFTTIESSTKLNDLCVSNDNSGIVMCANDAQPVQLYYIPQLGIAPAWCRFLDNLTEELDESQQSTTQQNTMYEDYKFITREQAEQYNITHMIHTNLLKPYMHGYFIKLSLYNKLQSVAEPESYDTYMKERVQKKLADKVNARTVVRPQKQAVNQSYANALQKQDNNTVNPIKDDRFSKLFDSSEFSIDTDSPEYQRVNPLAKQQTQTDKNNNRIHFDKTQKQQKSDPNEHNDTVDDSDEEDRLIVGRNSKKYKKSKLAIANMDAEDVLVKPTVRILSDTSDGDSDKEHINADTPIRKQKKHKQSHDDDTNDTIPVQPSTKHMSLAERLQYDQQQFQLLQQQQAEQIAALKKAEKQRFHITGKQEIKSNKKFHGKQRFKR